MTPQTVYAQLEQLDYGIVDYQLGLEGRSTKEIQGMQTECLRFLSLIASNRKRYSPSYLVDVYWHQCILTTKLYEQICGIAGKFIHHNPTSGSKEDQEKNTNSFWRTINDYENTFGEPDLKVWGIKKKIQEKRKK